MKRLSLSLQITIVFLLAFIITSVLVVFFVLLSLNGVYQNITYERLEAEGKALLKNTDENFDGSDMMAYIVYSTNTYTYCASDNIQNYIDQNNIKLIINKAAAQTKSFEQYINTIDGKTISFVVVKRDELLATYERDIVIVLTDNAMKKGMLTETSMRILILCFAAFSIGYLIIMRWVLKLAKDTKSVSTALKETQTVLYKTQINTSRRDEIGDLVESIEFMRAQIVQNEKQKQEIIQGVSHDLKTPIAVIQSYAEAAKDGLCDMDEAAGVIEKECNRLNYKVSELLNVTRLEYIMFNKETMGTTKMKMLIEYIVPLYQHRTTANFMLDLKEVTFNGDRESWRIVVQSILDNAIRYTNKKIMITLDKEKLTIANDGKQISEKMLPKLFGAFEKSEDGEFGIGLSTARRTTGIFGYRISAKNIKEGVQFSIDKETDLEQKTK